MRAPLKHIGGHLVVTALLFQGVASGEEPPPTPPPEVVIAAPASPDANRIRSLEEELSRLQASQQELMRTVVAMQSRIPADPPPAPAIAPPKPPSDDITVLIGTVPVRLTASVTLRYDYSTFANQVQLFQSDTYADGLRARMRLGVEFTDKDSPVIGGIRFAVGESPNPTVAFVALGGSAAAWPFGLDQGWGSYRPFHDRDRFGITIGKMPNPMWRGDGDRAVTKDQLVWDDDVNPEGVNVHLTLYRSEGPKPKWKLENNAAYFVVNDVLTTDFTGLTGVTYMIADQLHLTMPFVSAAFAFYDYENLNNGLLSPSFMPGSAFPGAGQNALLLRTGLWGTNNRVNVGPGADAFTTNAFRVLNAVANAHLPFAKWKPSLGEMELYLLADYTHNLSVKRDSNGWGVTLGFHAGDWKGGPLHPFNVWVTYRDVDADATLATFADSDLGAGTAYRGVETRANYRITRNTAVQVSYFWFMGYPNKDNQWTRLFLDATLDF